MPRAPGAWVSCERGTRRPVSLADCALLACAEPDDSIATLDAMLVEIAREERFQIVEL
jgi:hypothetical protein